MIEITLLGPPRGKERIRVTKTGHAYTPERTVNYESRLAYAAQQAMGDRLPLDGPLHVDMRIAMPITASWPKKRQEAARSGAERPTKKPDLDNIMKMLDALNKIAWIDDAQIVSSSICKVYSDKPGLHIRVWPLSKGVFS